MYARFIPTSRTTNTGAPDDFDHLPQVWRHRIENKAGLCFECDGEGTVTYAINISNPRKALAAAIALGTEAAAGRPVEHADAAAAFAVLEDTNRANWGEAGYAARNALGRLIGSVA